MLDTIKKEKHELKNMIINLELENIGTVDL